MAVYRFIGQPIGRIEDAALLTGAGRFVDDVPVPGSLEAAFVRSAFAHPQSMSRWGARLNPVRRRTSCRPRLPV